MVVLPSKGITPTTIPKETASAKASGPTPSFNKFMMGWRIFSFNILSIFKSDHLTNYGISKAKD